MRPIWSLKVLCNYIVLLSYPKHECTPYSYNMNIKVPIETQPSVLFHSLG